ncbi:4'-phosphopantetheinyl transferase superfamily protein [Xanthomonadaceae bacterium JHOS43]|nr:4'-phosphopantetheinyl transferase superfamily protein [Xanthomonadaceae bacterium JHOS43]MCX7564165.1 4'-phosphopantetheinyl transferase superfamily protein [Xanthomonadaceae bacterium XH05]
MSPLLGVRRIDELLSRLPDGVDWLGDQERARLARLQHPQRRAQFLAGHFYARMLLARYSGEDARCWTLERDAHGAPVALRGGDANGLQISLSHSGGWVACVVAEMPIGVDIECPGRERDVLHLARSLYPPEFVDALTRSSIEDRRRQFYVRWTLDEAFAKADGRGIRLRELAMQAWRPAPRDAADGWGWVLSEGFLAVAVQRPQPPLEFTADGEVPTEAVAWQREIYSISRIE